MNNNTHIILMSLFISSSITLATINCGIEQLIKNRDLLSQKITHVTDSDIREGMKLLLETTDYLIQSNEKNVIEEQIENIESKHDISEILESVQTLIITQLPQHLQNDATDFFKTMQDQQNSSEVYKNLGANYYATQSLFETLNEHFEALFDQCDNDDIKDILSYLMQNTIELKKNLTDLVY